MTTVTSNTLTMTTKACMERHVGAIASSFTAYTHSRDTPNFPVDYDYSSLLDDTPVTTE